MECEDIVIGTPLFKWYMDQPGIICDKITHVIKYNKYQPYKSFVELGCEMRRDNSNKAAATVWKLMLNAAFGKMAQNNAAYTNTLITNDGEKAQKSFNEATFCSADQMTMDGETIYQINSSKHRIKHDMPVQGACMIYSISKLYMLRFVYDFLDRFISRRNFQVMYTDTDSMWVAYTMDNPFGLPDKLAPTIAEANYPRLPSLCKKGMEEEFEKAKYEFLVMSDHDIRTPGLMKVEYSASELVCLAAKSYFAIPSRNQRGNKGGAKGIQKSNNLTILHYRNAMNGVTDHTVINRGFRKATGKKSDEMGLQMYEQSKKGVCAGDTKRITLPNGINKAPIEWPGEKQE